MAAQARTLLAKLGFADADRKSPRHDLACNYIGLNREVLTRALQVSAMPRVTISDARGDLEFQVLKGDGKFSTTVGFVDVLATFNATFTLPIPSPSDRSDRWRRSLLESYTDWISVRQGFQAVVEVKIAPCGVGDLIRQLRVYNEHVGRFQPSTSPSWSKRSYDMSSAWRAAIEAGRAKCEAEGGLGFGPLTYAFDDYVEKAHEILGRMPRITVAVLDFDTDAEYRKSLRSCGITPIRLGSGFENFLSSRSGATESSDEVEEI